VAVSDVRKQCAVGLLGAVGGTWLQRGSVVSRRVGRGFGGRCRFRCRCRFRAHKAERVTVLVVVLGAVCFFGPHALFVLHGEFQAIRAVELEGTVGSTLVELAAVPLVGQQSAFLELVAVWDASW